MFRKFRPHKVQIELLMPASGWSAPNRYVGDSPQKQTLYEQGQSPAPKIREYFYYIDHEGYVSFICALVITHRKRLNI